MRNFVHQLKLHQIQQDQHIYHKINCTNQQLNQRQIIYNLHDISELIQLLQLSNNSKKKRQSLKTNSKETDHCFFFIYSNRTRYDNTHNKSIDCNSFTHDN